MKEKKVESYEWVLNEGHKFKPRSEQNIPISRCVWINEDGERAIFRKKGNSDVEVEYDSNKKSKEVK